MLMIECSPPFRRWPTWFRMGRIWRVMFAYFGVSYVPFGFVSYILALADAAAEVEGNEVEGNKLRGDASPEAISLVAASRGWTPFGVAVPPEGVTVDLWCRHREDGWERRFPDMMSVRGRWRMMMGNVALDTMSPVMEPTHWREPPRPPPSPAT